MATHSLIHQWHRRIGITAVTFAILLVLSGLLLNHTEHLNLQDIYIKNELLLKWYKIQPKNKIKGFTAAKHWAVQIDNRLYFDQLEISNHVNSLFGMISHNHEFIIALDNKLLLLNADGEIIEKILLHDDLVGNIESIGLSDQREIILATSHGDYLVDPELGKWRQYRPDHAALSISQSIPDKLYQQLLTHYRGKGLTLERVISDIHSGRILGQTGILLVDCLAILLLLLSLSGIWMWYKYR